MDAWGWSALQPWLDQRATLPIGPLFCVIVGPTRGHRWSESAARLELHRTAIQAGVRRRFAPHQLRHAHAVELLHEGIPLPLIQRQLRHSHLSTTGTYLQGISSEEIISTVHARRAQMMHASAGLALWQQWWERTMRSHHRTTGGPSRRPCRSAQEQRRALSARSRPIQQRRASAPVAARQRERQRGCACKPPRIGPPATTSATPDGGHGKLPIGGHGISPLAAIVSPHGRPRFLPTVLS